MPVVRVNPDADVHFVSLELAEHHADLLVTVDRDEPGGLFGLESVLRRTDFIVQATGRGAGAVTLGADLLGAGGEDIAIGAVRKRREAPRFHPRWPAGL